jgi:hypothetical protein
VNQAINKRIEHFRPAQSLHSQAEMLQGKDAA